MTDPQSYGAASIGRRAWLGLAVGTGSALCFGMSAIFASEVYAAGGSPQAIIGVRLSAVFAVLLTYALIARKPIRLRPRQRATACALGVLMCFQTLSIYASFLFVPISLAVLIEYVYPLLVAILMRIVVGEPLTAVKLASIAAAFAGLSLVLQVSLSDLDARGVALAGLSAVGLSILIVATNRTLGGIDSLRIMLHMQPCGALVGMIAFLATDSFVLPATDRGMISLFAIAALNGIALFSMFSALSMAGPTRIALALSAEPVFVIVLSYFLLDEVLTPLQAAGGALIVGAIFAMQIWGGRKTAPARG